MRAVQDSSQPNSDSSSEVKDPASGGSNDVQEDGRENAFAKIRAANRKVRLLPILKSYGVKVKKNTSYAWSPTVTCPLPSHKSSNERTPSFGYNFVEDRFNCFSGDTRVLTRNGVFSIKDLSGKTVEVLGRKGIWVKGDFNSYGKQKLYEISLTRNRQKKIIYATAGHRWFVRNGKNGEKKREVLTSSLKDKDRLSHMFPICHSHQMSLSPFGIAHGIVFGDGTSNKTGGLGYLHGEKDFQLRKYFPLSKITKDNSREDKYIIHNLPRYFKNRPELTEATSYLFGWLAGYFAADGCVARDGTVMLNSAVKENLQFVRDVCTRLGIGTYGITEQKRKGYGERDSSLFRIHFVNKHLPPKFFLIEKHRDRFEFANKKYSRLSWIVRSVRETDRYEEVFCAEVDDGHAFTLEDNILTGNCFGCKVSGRAVEFIAEMEGRGRIAVAESILDVYSDSEFLDDPVEQEDPRVEKLLYSMANCIRESLKTQDVEKAKQVEKIVWWFDRYLYIRAGSKNSCSSRNIDVEELEARVSKAQALLKEIL